MTWTDIRLAEFAVSCIEDIHWTNLPFQNLVMPVKKKDMLQALVQEHLAGTAAGEASFDDVVKGKGQGLIILLHGPPGVGKTLTAEAISEYRHRPLYRVSPLALFHILPEYMCYHSAYAGYCGAMVSARSIVVNT